MTPRQPVQEHRSRKDQRSRICLVLACNVGRAAVLRLRAAAVISSHDREADAAGKLGRFIGKNIAEHVARDDYVETRWIPKQQRGHRIDDLFLQLYLGKIPRDISNLAQKQSVRDTQYIGLVHGCNLFAPLHRALECGAGDSAALPRGHLAHAHRHILGRHKLADALEHIAIGVKPFCAFPENDEVDRLARQPDPEA